MLLLQELQLSTPYGILISSTCLFNKISHKEQFFNLNKVNINKIFLPDLKNFTFGGILRKF